MKRIFAAFAVVLILSPAARVEAADNPLTVVELFTSQGCSSCPPADELLGELQQRDDVLPLSVHVDYWDYIGWKDPFAQPHHTDRQRQYSQRFELRYVYTPQMVVHGAFQAVGANRAEILDQIAKAKHLPAVAAKLTRTESGVQLDLPATVVNGDVEIVSIFADRKHQTKIGSGENGGRTLSYYNVVREMKAVGVWQGEARRMTVEMAETGGDICAVILQMAHSRKIIGAARIDLDGR
ncbi:MAG: DUF1223 domain-containing protein [Magnetovibrio sp.]|nr:DUF1223 domain-containing protein [Magnetovibrio sp.]